MSNLTHDGAAPPTAENGSLDGSCAMSPRVDVMETENEYLVLADMPGTKPEEVDIRFQRGELSVHGRRSCHNGECSAYQRTFAVADSVAADKITADLKAGVLTIHLPKVEAVKPKRIVVNG